MILTLNFILALFFGEGFFSNNIFFNSLLGALVGFLPFFFLWFFSAGKALGLGDVKFSIVLGLIFGWPLILINLFLSIFLGGLLSIGLLGFGGKTLKSKIPFGTLLTTSGFITLFCGKQLFDWYLRFLGF
jgi:prepilin signal peptidase PulO-like enzyme (type II secretory pathway)